MYEKIEDVSEQLKSKDVEVFLASQDRLSESVEYLRRNSTNIGAAEKLAELESMNCKRKDLSVFWLNLFTKL